MIAFVISFVCLCTEAFFSSAEIAIVSADRARMRELAQAGNNGAQWVERLLQHPHQLLSTTLLGTQLSVVTSTVAMTLWLHAHVPNQVELYLLVALTPTIIVFGEMVPKALARQHANAWAPTMAWMLHWARRGFFPLAQLLAAFSDSVSHKLGIEAQRKLISRQELELLLTPRSSSPSQVTAPASDITEGERSMIARILDLSDVTVDQIMVPLSGVVALPEESTADAIIREISENKYSRIPIYRDRLDQIIGVVHAFDVLNLQSVHQKVASLMRPPLYVPESHKAVDLLAQLRTVGENLAVVVDEYGGAVGIISQEDILEEIVGEIEDEYDEHPPYIYKQPDGSYLVSGPTPISAIQEKIGVSLPESEEYESIAGFLLEQFKRIPRVGESLSFHGAVFTVRTATERRIEMVHVQWEEPSLPV